MHRLNKYKQVFITTWENGFIYRLNFIMWRVRMILQLLAIFFLWNAVLKNSPNAFGYDAPTFLTYIFGSSFVRAIVFSNKSTGVQSDIGSGDLNNHLIRPINYFGYWFSQDLADKLLNILFSVLEIGFLLLILKPPLIPPASLFHAFMFAISVVLALIMWFYFSMIIGLSTFWMPEGNGWPQRFFVYVLLEFFSGGLFPLDILPNTLRSVITNLPTAYLLNHPMQIYLGRIPQSGTFQVLFMMIIWIFVFKRIAQFVFNRGVKIYGAYGR